jgi:hypothetical protein
MPVPSSQVRQLHETSAGTGVDRPKVAVMFYAARRINPPKANSDIVAGSGQGSQFVRFDWLDASGCPVVKPTSNSNSHISRTGREGLLR